MGAQRDRAKADAAQKKTGNADISVLADLRERAGASVFTGYDEFSGEATVVGLLVDDLPVIPQLLDHAGIDVVGVADYEAEDVIATLTRLAEGTVEIASGDRDLFALVQDPRVRVLYPVQANAVFVRLPPGRAERLHRRGWHFYEIAGGERLMCSWDTEAVDIDALVRDLRAATGEGDK